MLLWADIQKLNRFFESAEYFLTEILCLVILNWAHYYSWILWLCGA